MNKISKIPKELKSSIAYTLSNLIIKGLSIFTLPFFTNTLSLEEVGVTSIYSTWSSLLGVVASLSLCSSAFHVGLFEKKEDRNVFTSSILVLSSLSTLLLFIIYILFSDFFDKFIKLDASLIILMFIGFFVVPAFDLWIARKKYEFEYKKSVILSLLVSFLAIISSIMAISFFAGYSDVNLGKVKLFSHYIIMYLFSLIIYVLILKKSKFKINLKYWTYILPICLPLIIHTLSKHIMDTSDRLMIDYFIGTDAAGVYGTLYNIGSLSLIVWGAINGSLTPYMYNALSDKQTVRLKLDKIIKILLLFFGCVSIVISLVAPEVVLVLTNDEYYEYVYLIPPISAGIYLTSVYNIYANVLSFEKKTKIIMVNTICASFINIVLNLIFIPLLGVISASYTTLISFIVLAFLNYIFSKKYYCTNIVDIKFVLLMSIFTILGCVLCNLLYFSLIIRVGILLLILLFIIFFRKKIIKIFIELFRKNNSILD